VERIYPTVKKSGVASSQLGADPADFFYKNTPFQNNEKIFFYL